MSLGPLTFLNPLMLIALIGLPLLWYLLRVTPPAPQKIIFPAMRFLKGLIAEKVTPQKTPWWLLLLRCLMVACLILALAAPVLNPADSTVTNKNIRIVLDNGWAAAQVWDQQIETAEALLAQAQRQGQTITILTTAHEPGSQLIQKEGPMAAAQAQAILRGLTPYPWPANYNAVENATANTQESFHTFWLGHGMEEPGFKALADALKNQGGLTYYTPDDKNLPLLLKPSDETDNFSFDIERVKETNAPYPITLNALNESGNILHYERVSLDQKNQTVTLNIDDGMQNSIARIDIVGRNSAGTSLLLDERFKKRSVGIVTSDGTKNTKPLIDAAYYLDRALQPFTSLSTGTLNTLINQSPSVIILPDIGNLPPTILTRLEDWVKDGGLLLRFAGPEMAAAGSAFLTPVPVLKGARALEGDITWDKPLILAPFPENSPFYGFDIPETLNVRQQILSAPEDKEENTIWAALEDGTPLITGASLGKGRLVFIHTTATPAWSDLALSGLYVEILRKIVSLSGTNSSSTLNNVSLEPLSVMNGFGELVPPQSVKPIATENLETLIPSSGHPPGLYGQTGNAVAVNLGGRLDISLKSIPVLPLGTENLTYNKNFETDLTPLFLATAFALLLFDWIIMLAMTSGLRLPRRVATASLILFLLIPAPAKASDIQYAGDIYMAYISSGSASVDRTTEDGLNALADILRRRTSVEPRGTVKLNPETDTLSFFPLIFWPISENVKPLSDKAIQNIQSYLDQGGTILFDTRDQNINVGAVATTPNAIALQKMVRLLSVPALTPAPEDHVLRRSFYLIDGFPGRYSGGSLWVEEQSAGGRDGVSSILVGGHDWAAAWGATLSGGSLRPHLSGGPRQQEMAYRFGVNLMMYALTGNYKADQVHLPHILERLDQ